MTYACNTNKATRSKTKKLTFSFGGHEVLSSALFNNSCPDSNCFQAANQYVFGRKNPFAFPPKDCALLRVDFLSR